MPRPSCQMILMRSPREPRKTKRSPAWGSRRSASWTCRAKPFIPRLMSVRPTASQTRTFEGTGIIAAAQHVEYTLQRFRIDAAADADTILASKINLDRRRDSRGLRGDSILLRRNHHRD